MPAPDHPVGALAAVAAAPLPAGARARLLEAARARRPPGREVHAPTPLGPVACLAAGHDHLLARLRRLDASGWAAEVPFYPGWQVKDLAAHLVGVERYWGGELGLWPQAVPADLHDDHLASAGPAQAELRAASPAEVLAALEQAGGAVLAHLRGLDPDELRAQGRFHFLRQPLAAIVTLRAFELWIHGEDVAAAVGEDLPGLEGPRAATLGRLALGAIPLGIALAGLDHRDATVRMVLTGPGGGTTDVALSWGAPVGEPDAVVVVDVVGFCRVAGRRLGPDALPIAVDGDPALARLALSGAAVFAV